MTHPTMTLSATLWPAEGAQRALRYAVLAIAGTIILTLSAKVQVPFWPVPMTMQPFAVLVIAMAYGSRLGAATVLLYLAEGAAGLPVFAGTPEKGIGLAYMVGPTGGYLLGFAAAAALVGALAERGWDRRVATTALAMAAGIAVIYLFGVAWLTTLIGFEAAVANGLVPFLLGDALKIALAAGLMPTLWSVVRRRPGNDAG